MHCCLTTKKKKIHFLREFKHHFTAQGRPLLLWSSRRRIPRVISTVKCSVFKSLRCCFFFFWVGRKTIRYNVYTLLKITEKSVYWLWRVTPPDARRSLTSRVLPYLEFRKDLSGNSQNLIGVSRLIDIPSPQQQQYHSICHVFRP